MQTRRQFVASAMAASESLPVLIVDGRHNHDWKATTSELKLILEQAGFRVDVATAPPSNEALPSFLPEFARYRVVLPNYTDFGNGGDWAPAAKAAFAEYVNTGGGVVIVHAASSAFPAWRQYNEICGLGGWGGRDERSGPFLRFSDGVVSRDVSLGKAGHHGPQQAFTITTRAPQHPIVSGLPATWLHAKDELFDSLRGPAANLELLATAWSDPTSSGSGRDEPALFTVKYGRGRVFHTTLGHSPEAMRSTGFRATLQRGTEWAATGRVTQPPPAGFPHEN